MSTKKQIPINRWIKCSIFTQRKLYSNENERATATCNSMGWISQTKHWAKDSRHKTMHIARFHLYKVWKQAKLIHIVRSPVSGFLWGHPGRGMKGILEGLVMFFSWAEFWLPGVFSLWNLIQLFTYDLCTFLYTSKHLFLKKSKLDLKIWITFQDVSLSEKCKMWEFPGGPVVRTQRFHCRGPGFNPCQGTKIPQAAQRRQKKKKSKM